MTLTLYGLKTCDTCRKAIKALEAAGQTVNYHDVRADGASASVLAQWAKAVGWQALLNTRSTTWRGLSDTDKAVVDEKKALALMLKHPTLIKRPVIAADKVITVGWTKETQTALGL